MNDLLLKYTDRLSVIHKPNVMRLFKLLVYTWMLLNALYFFPVRHIIWGEYSMVMSFHPEQSLAVNVAYLLDHQRALTLPAYYTFMVTVLMALFGIGGRVIRVVVFFLGWLLYYASIPTFNGSYLLFQVFAFFLIFFGSPNGGKVDAVLSNIAFWSCRVQFLMVYSIAGIYKLTGSTWINGSSLWNALHLDHFTRPWLKDLLIPHKWLLSALSYFGVAYQVAFPILVWWKKVKTPLFIAGILFHSFIGIGMRLPEFGLAMIIGYSLFIEEETAEKWIRKLSFLPKRALR